MAPRVKAKDLVKALKSLSIEPSFERTVKGLKGLFGEQTSKTREEIADHLLQADYNRAHGFKASRGLPTTDDEVADAVARNMLEVGASTIAPTTTVDLGLKGGGRTADLEGRAFEAGNLAEYQEGRTHQVGGKSTEEIQKAMTRQGMAEPEAIDPTDTAAVGRQAAREAGLEEKPGRRPGPSKWEQNAREKADAAQAALREGRLPDDASDDVLQRFEEGHIHATFLPTSEVRNKNLQPGDEVELIDRRTGRKVKRTIESLDDPFDELVLTGDKAVDKAALDARSAIKASRPDLYQEKGKTYEPEITEVYEEPIVRRPAPEEEEGAGIRERLIGSTGDIIRTDKPIPRKAPLPRADEGETTRTVVRTGPTPAVPPHRGVTERHTYTQAGIESGLPLDIIHKLTKLKGTPLEHTYVRFAKVPYTPRPKVDVTPVTPVARPRQPGDPLNPKFVRTTSPKVAPSSEAPSSEVDDILSEFGFAPPVKLTFDELTPMGEAHVAGMGITLPQKRGAAEKQRRRAERGGSISVADEGGQTPASAESSARQARKGTPNLRPQAVGQVISVGGTDYKVVHVEGAYPGTTEYERTKSGRGQARKRFESIKTERIHTTPRLFEQTLVLESLPTGGRETLTYLEGSEGRLPGIAGLSQPQRKTIQRTIYPSRIVDDNGKIIQKGASELTAEGWTMVRPRSVVEIPNHPGASVVAIKPNKQGGGLIKITQPYSSDTLTIGGSQYVLPGPTRGAPYQYTGGLADLRLNAKDFRALASTIQQSGTGEIRIIGSGFQGAGTVGYIAGRKAGVPSEAYAVGAKPGMPSDASRLGVKPFMFPLDVDFSKPGSHIGHIRQQVVSDSDGVILITPLTDEQGRPKYQPGDPEREIEWQGSDAHYAWKQAGDEGKSAYVIDITKPETWDAARIADWAIRNGVDTIGVVGSPVTDLQKILKEATDPTLIHIRDEITEALKLLKESRTRTAGLIQARAPVRETVYAPSPLDPNQEAWLEPVTLPRGPQAIPPTSVSVVGNDRIRAVLQGGAAPIIPPHVVEGSIGEGYTVKAGKPLREGEVYIIPEGVPASELHHGVTRVISGFQDKVDIRGVSVAKELGYETGGWAPHGFITGGAGGRRNRPENARLYGAVEHPPGEQRIGRDGKPEWQGVADYRARTISNVEEADGTVWFGNQNSPGGILTIGAASKKGLKALVNPTPERLREWLIENKIKTLNVAGNGPDGRLDPPGQGDQATALADKVLRAALGPRRTPTGKAAPVQTAVPAAGPSAWKGGASTKQLEGRFEVSTTGYKEFSPFNAQITRPSGKRETIEDVYHLDVKGYRAQGGKDWRAGKRKPSLRHPATPEGRAAQYEEYKDLWRQWAKENPKQLEDLRTRSSGRVLTDEHAKHEINQARALFEILQETAPKVRTQRKGRGAVGAPLRGAAPGAPGAGRRQVLVVAGPYDASTGTQSFTPAGVRQVRVDETGTPVFGEWISDLTQSGASQHGVSIEQPVGRQTGGPQLEVTEWGGHEQDVLLPGKRGVKGDRPITVAAPETGLIGDEEMALALHYVAREQLGKTELPPELLQGLDEVIEQGMKAGLVDPALFKREGDHLLLVNPEAHLKYNRRLVKASEPGQQRRGIGRGSEPFRGGSALAALMAAGLGATALDKLTGPVDGDEGEPQMLESGFGGQAIANLIKKLAARFQGNRVIQDQVPQDIHPSLEGTPYGELQKQRNALRVEESGLGLLGNIRKGLVDSQEIVRQKVDDWARRYREQSGLEIEASKRPDIQMKLAMGGGGALEKLWRTRATGTDLEQIHKRGLVSQLEGLLDAHITDRALDSLDTTTRSLQEGALQSRLYGRGVGDLEARAAHMRGLTPGERTPMGATRKDAAQARADILNHPTLGDDDKQLLLRSVEGIDSYVSQGLKEAASEGLIDGATVERLLASKHPYARIKYLMRARYEGGPDVMYLVRQNRINQLEIKQRGGKLSLPEEQVLKRLVGANQMNRASESPLVATVNSMEELGKEISRNRAAKSFQHPLRADPTADLRVDADGNIGNTGGWLADITGRNMEIPPGYSTISYYEGGSPRTLLVPQEIADATNFSTAFESGTGIAALQKSRTLLQVMATSANLGFLMKNLPRDVVEAFMLTPGLGIRDVGAFAKLWGRNVYQIRKGTISEMREEFMRAGASGAGLTASINPRLEAYGSTPRNPLMRVVRETQSVLNATEEATKQTVYELLRRKGIDKDQAAYWTRNFGGSPDYAVRGTVAPRLSEWVMFFNPQIQGADRIIRAYRTDPWKMAEHLAGITMAAGALHAYNSSFINPDTGRPEIEEIPEDQRHQSLIIMVPGAKREINSLGQMRQPYIRLPLGHAAQVLYTPILDAIRASTGDKSVGFEETLGDTASTLVPGNIKYDPTHRLKSLGLSAISAINPIPKVFAELALDTNAQTGTPIEGRRLAQSLPSERYNERSSPFFRDLYRNAPFLPGSPLKAEHALRSFLPGLGEMALSVADAGVRATEERSPRILSSTEEAVQAPILGQIGRGFVGTPSSQTREDLANRLFDTYEQVQQHLTDLNRYRKGGGPDARAQVERLKARPVGAVADRLSRPLGAYVKAVADLSKQRQLVQDSEIPPSRKEARIRSLWKMELSLLQKADHLISQTLPPP